MKSINSRLILLILASTINTAFCLDIPAKFRDFILPTCYSNDFVNGQEHPLAQTLDNLISLVEKLEDANPDSTLNDVLGILLKTYTHDNIERGPKGGYKVFTEENYQEKYITRIWQDNINKNIPPHINPFSNDEVCSLYYMLSHTVNITAIRSDESGPEENGWTKQPRELGIVSIERSRYSIAIGRVILGLYLGLNANPERKTVESVVEEEDEALIPEDVKTKKINPLTVLTFADALVLANLNHDDRHLDDVEGAWIGLHDMSEVRAGIPDILKGEVCPTVFVLPQDYGVQTIYYTVPVLHGALDGLILGNSVKEIARIAGNRLRLSQILRMYYDNQGINVISQANSKPLTFCNRKELIDTEDVKEQIDIFIHLAILDPLTKEKILQAKVYEKYIEPKSLLPNGDLKECKKSNGVEKQELSNETPIDVIAVIDTSDGEKNIDLQQQILGIVANSLNLSRNGTSMTILLDSDSDNDGYLKELIPRTHSSSCAACHVLQYNIDKFANDPEDHVVSALDKMLHERKGNESSKSGAPGKVVIYFDFEDDNSDDGKLDAALQNFRLRHQDVRFFAVGRNQDLLTKLAGNKANNIIIAFGEEPSLIAEDITSKISLSTARLQYLDCRRGSDESNAIYEGLISPYGLQRLEMHPQYFVKSYTPIIYFEVNDEENIKVCQSRATTASELNEANCQSTNSSVHKLPFQYPNPCRGFSVNNCSPFYFTVIGLPNSQNGVKSIDQYCTDATDIKCKTLDQIKFKVSHQGVRCSGSSGIISNTFYTLMLVCFVLFYTSKNC